MKIDAIKQDALQEYFYPLLLEIIPQGIREEFGDKNFNLLKIRFSDEVDYYPDEGGYDLHTDLHFYFTIDNFDNPRDIVANKFPDQYQVRPWMPYENGFLTTLHYPAIDLDYLMKTILRIDKN